MKRFSAGYDGARDTFVVYDFRNKQPGEVGEVVSNLNYEATEILFDAILETEFGKGLLLKKERQRLIDRDLVNRLLDQSDNLQSIVKIFAEKG